MLNLHSSPHLIDRQLYLHWLVTADSDAECVGQLEAQYNALKDDLDTNLASKIAEREALKSSMAEKERLLKRSEAEAEEHFKVYHKCYCDLL
jgi:hypothetical protein